MIRLWFAAILFLFLFRGCAGWAAEKPALAIINSSGDHAVADLLFSKLSAGGDFVFVEREHLAEILREQQLGSLSPENNVRAGKLLGADALLFVEPERTLLRLRLVETSRGERLLDEAFPLSILDAPSMAETVQEQLSLLAAKLQTPPHDRFYVALGAVSTFRPTPAFGETLSTLSTLIGVRLADQDRVLVVERENLASVAMEQTLTGKSAADLAQADAIVRSRLVDGDATKLQMEFQVQRSAGDSSASFSVTVDRTHLPEAAASISAKIAASLGIAAAPAPTQGHAGSSAEAPRQYQHGLILLHAQLFEPALRFLETACLLDPANETYARTYLGAVAACILERVGGNADSATRISSTDYLFYTDRLRSAMAVASVHPPAVSAPLAEGRRVCTFLAVRNDSLDADTLAQVAACRTELRAFYERFASSEQAGAALLGDYCPLFFEEPRAALAYLRGAVEAGHYPWARLREHVYPHVAYWDQPQAVQLWNAYLDEVARKPGLDAQFSALAGRCYLQGTFPGEYATSQRGQGRPAAEQLFTWLAESDEHLQWMLAHEKWDIFLRVWAALEALPIEEQDGYFESIMLKVLAQAKGSEHFAFEYLASRGTRQDGPRLRKFLGEALDCLAATNPPLYRDTLAKLAGNKRLAPFMESPAKTGPLMPKVPGGILLYDSMGEGAATRDNFDCFAGLAEGDVLWLARIQPKALAVTRVQISQRTSESCLIPVEGAGNSAFEQLVIGRSQTHLFVADRFRVFAIPVAAKAPFLDAAHCEIAGPKFGADETGGTYEREVRTWNNPRFRRVTAAIPAGDTAYIGLDQRNHDNSNRYGALYRWRPGAGEPKLVCASDSLKPGPLNDCLPYSIAGGCAAPGGEAVYFVLKDVPRQPAAQADGQRRGLWKLLPSTGAWVQMSDARLSAASEQPRLRAASIFDIPGTNGTHHQLDLGSRMIRSAAGIVSGPEQDRGWSSVLEEESGVRYNRLYRMEGNQSTRVLSLFGREFNLSSLLPTENGLIVLLAGLQPGGNAPTKRGLAYLLPREK